MTNFLIWFSKWIKDPKHQRNLAIVTALIVIILVQRCSPSHSEVNTLKQNLYAMNDSIRTYQTKNGQLIYEKGALIAESKTLKDYNRVLYEEIKYLKDHPITVIKTEVRIVEVPKYIPIYPQKFKNTSSLFCAFGLKTTRAREKSQIFLIKPKNSHLGMFF